jgi:hypothetical protein
MATMKLSEFISSNRDELIGRCRAKVAKRSAPATTDAEIDHGVPLFLHQLVNELRHGPSKTHEISTSAIQYGHELLLQGFTVSQVVHNYGDVCQSVTDLAMETGAPIATDEFRTLNGCLDDAIAGAVTEYSRGQQVTRDGHSDEMRRWINTAITAFEVLQSGRVGIGGTTGRLLSMSLTKVSALIERPVAETTQTTAPVTSNLGG